MLLRRRKEFKKISLSHEERSYLLLDVRVVLEVEAVEVEWVGSEVVDEDSHLVSTAVCESCQNSGEVVHQGRVTPHRGTGLRHLQQSADVLRPSQCGGEAAELFRRQGGCLGKYRFHHLWKQSICNKPLFWHYGCDQSIIRSSMQ